MPNYQHPVLELTVNNHPGVMSHITGLFSRRIFNLEGILCGTIGDGSQSKMLLMVNEDHRLSRVIKELNNLHDVLSVKVRVDVDPVVFDPLRAVPDNHESTPPVTHTAESSDTVQ